MMLIMMCFIIKKKYYLLDYNVIFICEKKTNKKENEVYIL